MCFFVVKNPYFEPHFAIDILPKKVYNRWFIKIRSFGNGAKFDKGAVNHEDMEECHGKTQFEQATLGW